MLLEEEEGLYEGVVIRRAVYIFERLEPDARDVFSLEPRDESACLRERISREVRGLFSGEGWSSVSFGIR